MLKNKDQFNASLAKASRGGELDHRDIITLLAADGMQAAELFSAADSVRQRSVGDEVHLRALIEFSNYCRKNCLYCGLRRDNSRLPRYRLTGDEIMAAAGKAAAMGYRTVVLQSGEDLHYSAEVIADLINMIKSRHQLAVTLSLGERTRDEYKQWREAGADRYLLKHETADSDLFRRLKPDTTLEQRLSCLLWLKELGYQTGSGNMVGLPGQNLDILAKDILLMRKLGVEMAGIGPFLPHFETPLGNEPAGELKLTLKVLAVARLCLPQAHLPVTTSLCTLTPQGRQVALSCGGNVIMPNLTPAAVRGKYLIYPQKADITDQPDETLSGIKKLLAQMSRPVAQGYGHAGLNREVNSQGIKNGGAC